MVACVINVTMNTTFIAPINVTTSVVGSTEIFVSWVIPQSIIDQGVARYQVAVTSFCSTEGVLPTQLYTITPQEEPALNISGLGNIHVTFCQICKPIYKPNVYIIDPLAPYQVRMTVEICLSVVEVYNSIVQTQGCKLHT